MRSRQASNYRPVVSPMLAPNAPFARLEMLTAVRPERLWW
jgi:hypothetical protein